MAWMTGIPGPKWLLKTWSEECATCYWSLLVRSLRVGGSCPTLRPHIKWTDYPHKDILMWSIWQMKRWNKEILTLAWYLLLRHVRALARGEKQMNQQKCGIQVWESATYLLPHHLCTLAHELDLESIRQPVFALLRDTWIPLVCLQSSATIAILLRIMSL